MADCGPGSQPWNVATGFITLEDGKRKYFYGKMEKEVLKKIRQAIYERDQGTLSEAYGGNVVVGYGSRDEGDTGYPGT